MYKQVIFFWCLLLLSLGMMAQAAPDGLQEKFIQYQLSALQEKIFVHADKTFYLAGEMIWFKIYTVDESFNKPSNISKVAYVEIISDDLKAVMQAKIALQDGSGDGSFIIPSSLASGSYKIRSYTSRMRNFSADYYFEQPLTIVNALKEPLVKNPATAAAYHIDFFPEGGNLVRGLAAVVAYKITDRYGKGVDATGYIINGKKDTISQLTTVHAGMGRFEWLPQKEISYQAVFRINDTSIAQDLPPVYEQGYCMRLTDSIPDDLLAVSVSASGQPDNATVYLFVHTRHLVKQVLTGQLVNGKTVFRVSKNKLGDGISHITVFNAGRQAVCERLYCKRPVNKLVIQANTDKLVYSSRGKINIAVQTTDKASRPLAADMSVAVFRIDSLQPLQYQDIHSWLLLQSELAGNIESPAYYFNDGSAAATAALDNLMLTQGWRRFKWEDVLNNKMPVFEFISEQEGPVIAGMLTDKNTGLPKKNTLATASIPGNHFELRSTVSRQDGSILFNFNNFYSSNDIIVQTVNAADSAVKITVSNPFSDKFSARLFPRFVLSDKWKDEIVYRSINLQADNAYLADKKRQSFATPDADSNVFYGKPDKQYYLDDYTRFITMDEVMKEFVLDVRVRKQADGFQFRVVNSAFKSFFEQDPLVLIDGVPVYNVDKIMTFDPLKIKAIDVVTHRHYLGPMISDGIVSYKTYEGNLGGYELDPHAVVIEYEGLQRQREFYSPVYDNSAQTESRIPDTRNLLYWSPSLKTGPDGKQQCAFYTSDLKGHFAVIVQGLTDSGLSGSGVSTFTVGK
ncbi:MAG: hypothetical protein ABIQ88_06560 [Chitinophagaceae bacterium]